jgi:hypothetical protein
VSQKKALMGLVILAMNAEEIEDWAAIIKFAREFFISFLI